MMLILPSNKKLWAFTEKNNKHRYLYAGGGDSECTFSCGSYYET